MKSKKMEVLKNEENQIDRAYMQLWLSGKARPRGPVAGSAADTCNKKCKSTGGT